MRRNSRPLPPSGAAWLLGLLLVASGCAHQSGALAPGATTAPPAAAIEPAPPAGGADLAAEDDLDQPEAARPAVADPLGGWNRAMFTFNDKFYFWVLKPVSRAYRAVVPGLARSGVENFFDNLGAPKRFVSNLLQFKGREASIELGKFVINSTWGVLGFGNWFAKNPETTVPETDFGLTLAYYGVGPGPYVVWPFLGSYTVRDSFGWAGGLVADPVSYVHPLTLSLGTRTYEMVNYTSFRIGDYESLKDASIDPYLATRDAYLQYRAEKVEKARK
jgi:phospholipid-binding lipoprotein MlaA